MDKGRGNHKKLEGTQNGESSQNLNLVPTLTFNVKIEKNS